FWCNELNHDRLFCRYSLVRQLFDYPVCFSCRSRTSSVGRDTAQLLYCIQDAPCLLVCKYLRPSRQIIYSKIKQSPAIPHLCQFWPFLSDHSHSTGVIICPLFVSSHVWTSWAVLDDYLFSYCSAQNSIE